MAKKKTRRSTRKSKKVESPQHELPSGFWQQVTAIGIIAFSLLLIVSWFGGGGDLLNWMRDLFLSIFGYAMFVIPVVAIYCSIQVFRSEENRIPGVMKFASVLIIIWISGLTSILRTHGGPSTGGFVGDTLNDAMSALATTPVAIFIYLLLIFVTGIFMLRISFKDVGHFFKTVFGRGEAREDAANVDVMRRVATEDKKGSLSDFKLNAGVPTLSPEEQKKARAATLKNSIRPDKEAEEKAAMLAITNPNWKFPNIDMLEKKQAPADAGDINQNAHTIQDTLHEFNIDVEMEGANIGPKVTQYTLKPPAGTKLSRITALETNIALSLAASSLRIEAPIPGQKAVGIEVPNKKAADVRIRGILDSDEWRQATEPLSFTVGKDIAGKGVVGELNKMPHLLIAGTTGSGKSVMINSLLCSLLYRNAPSDMKLILVDPKQVEMALYEDIPHLLTPVITEPEKTISALKWAVNEMERRYSLLAEEKVRDIKSYNEKVRAKAIGVTDEDGNVQQVDEGRMPYIVIVIDELADLMMVAARDVEALIIRIAQKARAVGIHLVLATQSPRADVITGLMKANIPARIAFTVAQELESRIIMDTGGAEKLLGNGDMLMKTAALPKPKRIQGAWVTDSEVTKITDHLRMQSAPQYNDEIVSQPVQLNGRGGVVMDFSNEGGDSMFKDACRVVIESRKASTSLLQRKLRIGYARAARIIEEMEEQGIIGPADGSRPRDVLIRSMDEVDGDASSDV